jgi:NADPH:quinone reductase-like Zn-dependent oxidoreductase
MLPMDWCARETTTLYIGDWGEHRCIGFGLGWNEQPDCWKTTHEKLFWMRLPKSSLELRQLQEWAESGKLTPTVSNVYKFSVAGVQAAFDEILSRRTVGKVVVRVLTEENAGTEQELSKKI